MGAGTPPDHLDDVAKIEWERVSALLIAAGILTAVDRAVLAMYCSAWSRWVKCEQLVSQSSEVIKTKDGNLYQNPYLSAANQAAKQVKELAAVMGLDPSSRSRLNGGARQETPVAAAFVRPRIFASEANLKPPQQA